jgi:molybdopterin-containing oxidoreductase family iron-sulfur binding subunit
VNSLMQPVMEPVFNTLPAGDVLLRVARKMGGPLARFTAATYKDHLQSRWQALAGEGDFGTFWHAALQRGGVFAEAPASPPISLAPGAGRPTYTKPAFEGDGEFVFAPYPHAMLYDGRGANKPWLLENSDPVTKITWHSWVEVHPETARRLDVRDGEVLRLTSPHGAIEAPVYVYAGIHPDVVSVPLGLGHTEYGAYARGRGVNALDLIGAPAGAFLPYVSTRVTLEKTGGYKKLASIAGNPRQLGRGISEAHDRAGVHGRGPGTARDQHRTGAGRDQRMEPGAGGGDALRRLRRRQSALGHVNRSGEVHRLSGVRHRMLRRE